MQKSHVHYAAVIAQQSNNAMTASGHCMDLGQWYRQHPAFSDVMRASDSTHLFGLGADSVPDRVQLAANNIIKALKEPVL